MCPAFLFEPHYREKRRLLTAYSQYQFSAFDIRSVQFFRQNLRTYIIEHTPRSFFEEKTMPRIVVVKDEYILTVLSEKNICLCGGVMFDIPIAVEVFGVDVRDCGNMRG